MTEIKCLLLDLDNTIYPEVDYFRQILSHFATKHDLEMTVIDSYLQNFEYLRQHERDIFRHFLAHTEQLTNSSHEELFQLYVTSSAKLLPSNGVVNIIDSALNSRLKVSVLTNGVAQAQRNKWLSLELPRKSEISFFSSREILGDKPNHETFEYWRESMNVSWSEVLTIGDNYKNDLEYPLNHGSVGVLVDRGSSSVTTKELNFEFINVVSNLEINLDLFLR